VQGFFRNRGGARVAPNVGKEGRVASVLDSARDWLAKPDEQHDKASCIAGLETLEIMANLLEAGEMVPMVDAPRTTVWALQARAEPETDRIRGLIESWSRILEQHRGPEAD